MLEPIPSPAQVAKILPRVPPPNLATGQLSSELMGFFSSALMVVIFMFFLLLGGSSDIVPRTEFWIEVEASIRQYIVTKTVISAVTGAVFAFVLWLFGVPLALLFGILAFLLNFIPNVGPVIAGLLPIPLIVLDPEMSYLQMGIVITLCVAVQFVSGNIIEPKMMGDSVKLPPDSFRTRSHAWAFGETRSRWLNCSW